MSLFKFVISNKSRSVQLEKDQKDCPILGKKIGDNIDGAFLGLDGYELTITGGHDKDGFAMIKNVDGIGKRSLLLTRGVGFNARLRRKKILKRPIQGLRKRKTIRANTIATDIVQVNCKIKKEGSKSFDEMFPPKVKEEKAEA